MAYTPMIQQYLKIKQNHRDAILFFRLGDFYEMFFDDALLASRELEITLTGRDGGAGERVPMCGVPYHAADTYIARLVEKGYKVAICEQVEEAGTSRGIVRREVTRIVTPGTVLGGGPDEKDNNYLVALTGSRERGYGLAYTDISTGIFKATEFLGENPEDGLADEVLRLRPAEILLPEPEKEGVLADFLSKRGRWSFTYYDAEAFTEKYARRVLLEHFDDRWINKKFIRHSLALSAAGGLLAYLHETQKRKLLHLNKIEIYSTGEFMLLDAATRRNLEICFSLADGSRSGTLLWVLDRTSTAMGSRLLRSWLEQPLLNVDAINRRLDAVEQLKDDLLMRERIKRKLKEIYDIERLIGRIGYGTANARDLVALRDSLRHLPELREIVSNSRAELLKAMGEGIDTCDDLYALLKEAIADNPPLSVREGNIIRDGFHKDVDKLREASKNGKEWLARLEAEERERTGIKSLKIGYNKVFGYYLEVTRANLNLVPPDYVRRQTLANAERYITEKLKEYEDLILGSEERLARLEYQLFNEILSRVMDFLPALQRTSNCIAVVDALVALAESAAVGNYVRPTVTDGRRIYIREGRHPVIERVLGPGEFVPNDVLMDENERLIIITGPNMAGKSTFMRQVALIVLMAQAGSFVPATDAEIGLVDKILTRVGAADDLAGGRSTFMVEMCECKAIIDGATDRSLVIMDEVGRGTSTYDGMSIARALIEYIHEKIRARTLFSTHYHELTDMEQIPGIRNYTVTVREVGDEIIFLRKVVPGRVNRSYGIQVARLAGLPEEILNRARQLLKELEISKGTSLQQAELTENGSDELNGRIKTERDILKQIYQLNIDETAPLKALNLLAEWQRQLLKES